MSTAVTQENNAATPWWKLQPADLAHIAVFAALVAALALTPQVMLPFGVPITFQTIAVGLAGLCLGPLRGFLALLLYVVVGAAGLPVFSGGRAGLTILTSTPTGGYLLSFPLVALLVGFVARRVLRGGLSAWTPLWFFLAQVLARVLVMWPLAAVFFVNTAGMSFPDALKTDMAFWPLDALKAAVAALLAVAVHKAFPRLMR